jgi:hypothetical protein
MHNVEIKRARRFLFWYAGALIAIVLLTGLGLNTGHLHIDHGRVGVTMSELLGVATFGAFIAATAVAPGLASEAATIAIVWTRPIPRTTIAWRYIAVDVLTIILAYTMLFLVALVILALLGELPYVRIDPAAPATLFRGLGAAFMWYSLVVLATSRFPARASAIAGATWGMFTIVSALSTAPLLPVFHDAIVAANYLNPMAYFGSVGHGVVEPVLEGSGARDIIMLSVMQRTFLEWIIAVIATVAVVRLWSTREA